MVSVIAPNAAMVDYGLIFGGSSVVVPNAAMFDYGILFGGMHP